MGKQRKNTLITYTRNKERAKMVLFARNHARLVATHIKFPRIL